MNIRLLITLPLLLMTTACATTMGMNKPPPRNLTNACEIFDERGRWRDPIFDAARKWDVTPGTIMAFIRQESSFRHNARPVDRNGNRISSAFGWSQALDGTWAEYERAEGRGDRQNLRHAANFIGWYLDRVSRQTGIERSNVRDLYLAYHDGPGGFTRGTWRSKGWLIDVAGRVAGNAETYDDQLRSCHWWAMRRFRDS